MTSLIAGFFVAGFGLFFTQDDSRPVCEQSALGQVGLCESSATHLNVHQYPSIVATSSTKSSECDHEKKSEGFDVEGNNTVELPIQQSVDFIIVGYGNAGRAAAKELMEKCPRASILVIDQHSLVAGPPQHAGEPHGAKRGGSGGGGGLLHLTGSVVTLDHSNQAVDVITSGAPPCIKRIRYKHSILIASGARGAPLPEYLVDERAAERILEMKSTRNPFVNQYVMHKHRLVEERSKVTVPHLFPVLPAQTVRSITLMAASQGAKVCILGSDLDSVELAVALANRRRDKMTTSAAGLGTSTGTNNHICLMFGGAAPLGSMLPKYLSVAVAKRLKSHGIHVADRSLVRYISSVEDDKRKSQGRVEVFSAKSYDTMETNRYQADLVVGKKEMPSFCYTIIRYCCFVCFSYCLTINNIVCPRVKGQQGNASVPIPRGDIPTLEYKPWSKMCPENNCVVSCFSDDSRIVVNSELNAASNVFAAGSVAKYPNHDTGHATVAGEGILGGSEAGKIAASNMAKHFRQREKIGGEYDNDLQKGFIGINSLPIQRTDQVSSTRNVHGAYSELESVGVHALFVGVCDSETMSTHGFWWTNQSRSLTRRRSIAKLSKQEKMNKYVYGSGVVFYLDRAGAIRGIMLWGLPFTETAESTKIKASLLERMKMIIKSNGEIMQRDYQSVVEEMRLDPSLLYPFHLAEESRTLASLAIDNSPGALNVRLSGRPQHRFVPSKPISVTKMGVLSKNIKIGNGGVGEDIFERTRHDIGYINGERARHPSLLHYFQYDWNTAHPTPVDNTDNEGVAHEYHIGDASYSSSKYPDLAARPPKEEQLWMRKGEMAHAQATNDKLAAIFMHSMKHGHFSDGSDAVKQAPVPQIIKDAKAWMTRSNGDSDE
jgi:NADH dehydrogenase FAD-containing subunit